MSIDEEIYREYYSCKEQKYLIVVFKHLTKYLGRIYFEDKSFAEFPVDINEEMLDQFSQFSVINFFEEAITFAKKSIEEGS